MEILSLSFKEIRFWATSLSIFSSNSSLYDHKRNWIDFDCGVIAEGKSVIELGEELFRYVLLAASGKKVKSEEAGFHDMAIFKQGVTL